MLSLLKIIKLVLTLLGKVLKKTLFAINAIFTKDIIKLVLTLLGKVLKKTLFTINAIITKDHKTRFNTSGQGFKKTLFHYQCYLY